MFLECWRGEGAARRIRQHLDQQFHRAQSNERYTLICLVFFHTHPEGKKQGGYMINVYIYVGERDMIYDYICMLDLCLYIVARDNLENWDETCRTLSVLRLLTETERQHHIVLHICETLFISYIYRYMSIIGVREILMRIEVGPAELSSSPAPPLFCPWQTWHVHLTRFCCVRRVLGFCLFGAMILPTHICMKERVR